jgi:hypothetical protein
MSDDEDDLGITDTGTASVGTPIELTQPEPPPRNKGGRPRGSKAKPQPVITPQIIKQLTKVAAGEAIRASGPQANL